MSTAADRSSKVSPGFALRKPPASWTEMALAE